MLAPVLCCMCFFICVHVNTLLDPLIGAYEPSLEFRADLVDANKHVHDPTENTSSLLDHTSHVDNPSSLVSVFSTKVLYLGGIKYRDCVCCT